MGAHQRHQYVNARLLGDIHKGHGERAKWKVMEIQLMKYTGSISTKITELMVKSMSWPAPMKHNEMNEEERQISQRLRIALGSIFRGQALSDLEQLEAGNGFEAYRTFSQRNCHRRFFTVSSGSDRE